VVQVVPLIFQNVVAPLLKVSRVFVYRLVVTQVTLVSPEHFCVNGCTVWLRQLFSRIIWLRFSPTRSPRCTLFYLRISACPGQADVGKTTCVQQAVRPVVILEQKATKSTVPSGNYSLQW